MRRLVKEELPKFDGTPLFPERFAYTVNYDLSAINAELYTAVTNYVRQEFNRADKLSNERKTTVGFALTVLQRRLASSPEAIYQSLKRRRERLENRLAEERFGKRAAEYSLAYIDDLDEDDLPSGEAEDVEEQVTDQASAASTIAELEAEIATLKHLEGMAGVARSSGEDRKWKELSRLLQDDNKMFGSDGLREKLIIFTEHRDTLRYLTGKIRSLMTNEEAVVAIHGGMLRDERRKVEELFRQDKEVRILIATDAAGEGINLQRAHLMVNYDLPWNPNRLEQRFGRIHRIGQTEGCHLWNLVAKETREGMVFQRLFEKLEQERESLKGKVFDILGKLTFENRSLRELLIEAIRYNEKEDVRARLYQVVDNSLDTEKLKELIDEYALTEDTMDIHQVMKIREHMERIEVHKLQPHFIEAFFIEAFTGVGGKIRPRENGRYEISTVPFAIRPAHVTEVRERKIKLIEKTARAVKERLTTEIQYWDFRAAELKQKEDAGQVNARLNSQAASRRAEELAVRMQKRLAELETERFISAMPPTIIGGALVIPRGLLDKLQGKVSYTNNADSQSRRETELAAMKAVLDIETSLGFIPRDVSAEKHGMM
jgi:hypothetical protein